MANLDRFTHQGMPTFECAGCGLSAIGEQHSNHEDATSAFVLPIGWSWSLSRKATVATAFCPFCPEDARG